MARDIAHFFMVVNCKSFQGRKLSGSMSVRDILVPRHLFFRDVLRHCICNGHFQGEVLDSEISRVEQSRALLRKQTVCRSRCYLHCLCLLCFFSLFPVLPETGSFLHSSFLYFCHIPFAGPKNGVRVVKKNWTWMQGRHSATTPFPTLLLLQRDLRGWWWLHTKLILAMRLSRPKLASGWLTP